MDPSKNLAIRTLNGDHESFIVLQDLDEENGSNLLRGALYEKLKRLGSLADPTGFEEINDGFQFSLNGKRIRIFHDETGKEVLQQWNEGNVEKFFGMTPYGFSNGILRGKVHLPANVDFVYPRGTRENGTINDPWPPDDMHVRTIILYEDDLMDISDSFIEVADIQPQDDLYKELREIFDKEFVPVESKISKIIGFLK